MGREYVPERYGNMDGCVSGGIVVLRVNIVLLLCQNKEINTYWVELEEQLPYNSSNPASDGFCCCRCRICMFCLLLPRFPLTS